MLTGAAAGNGSGKVTGPMPTLTYTGASVPPVTGMFAEGKTLTPDQGGRATTVEFCDAVSKAIEGKG